MEMIYKTLEEHRDYLYKIVRLKLFFLHRRLREHPEEHFRDVLRNRVDIYRKTAANPGWLNPPAPDWDSAAWQKLENAARRVYDQYADDAEEFEERAFAVFRPSIDVRTPKDYLDRSGLAGYQCGSLRFDLHETRPVETAKFHIANALSPRSIFDDRLYLADCFMALMRRVELLYDAKNIATHTWLNANPRWLELFPEEWQTSLGEPNPDIQWHYGFWGQFITARGTFHDKAGAAMRATGRMPYLPRGGVCSIAAMRRHLDENFYGKLK